MLSERIKDFRQFFFRDHARPHQGQTPVLAVKNIVRDGAHVEGADHVFTGPVHRVVDLQPLEEGRERARVLIHRKPLLEKSRGPEERPVIVMATVEGDIHDIGKNIVCLLLGNHGFDVIDAGKDVPAEQIVACALEHKARIIGLSALMTTTMVRMEDTIRLVRERNLPIKVLVGGAAVTQAFADAIGADAYCEDAVSAVRAAKQFVTG